MAQFVLIHFEQIVEHDRISLVGVYETQDEAQKVMQALYDSKLSEPNPDCDWEYDLCGISGIDAVVQNDYCCYRWFIFNSDDAGIGYIF